MLKKLLRYEFLSFHPILFLPYPLALGFAALLRFSNDPQSLIYSLASTFYTMSIFALVLLTVFHIFRRFRSSLLGAEGHVSHSLPVSIGEHIVAKLIPATLFAGLSLFFMGLSAYILPPQTPLVAEFPFGLKMFFEPFQNQGLTLIFSLISGVLTLIMTVLSLYSALSIGQMMRRSKLLWSFLVFLGLNFLLASTFMAILEVLSAFLPATETMAYFVLLLGALLQIFVHFSIVRGMLSFKLNLR